MEFDRDLAAQRRDWEEVGGYLMRSMGEQAEQLSPEERAIIEKLVPEAFNELPEHPPQKRRSLGSAALDGLLSFSFGGRPSQRRSWRR